MATFDARRHAITSRARRSVSVLSALILGLASAAPASGGATFDVAGWRRDFQHLKQEMAQRYANLDWIVSHRGLDLAALDAETGAAIERARSDGQAAAALRRFIGAFEDPHLKLVRGDRSSPPGTAGPAAVPRLPDPPAAVASCEAAGYRWGTLASGFPSTGCRAGPRCGTARSPPASPATWACCASRPWAKTLIWRPAAKRSAPA
ncbi:hypothetical protein [Brevundimonas sp. UBA2416]|uniref:hypothetical protein n=1 Tax=Brevundimonas sp. UBA2416 TaxID=1946124 RepID=UPI0025C4B785|nr:hypothetical protein [Brevundimonas sp. UBA2416]